MPTSFLASTNDSQYTPLGEDESVAYGSAAELSTKAATEDTLPLPTSGIVALYQLFLQSAITHPHIIFALALLYKLEPYFIRELTAEEEFVDTIAELFAKEGDIFAVIKTRINLKNHDVVQDIINDFREEKSLEELVHKTILTMIRDSYRTYYSDENLQGKVCGPAAEAVSGIGTAISSFAHLPLISNCLFKIPAWSMRASKAAVNIGIAKSGEEFHEVQRTAFPQAKEDTLLPPNQPLDAGLTPAQTKNLAYAEAGIAGVNITFNIFSLMANLRAPHMSEIVEAGSAMYNFVPMASAAATSLLGLNVVLNTVHQVYTATKLCVALGAEWERIKKENLNSFFLSTTKIEDEETKALLAKIKRLRTKKARIEKEIADAKNLILNQIKLQTINAELYATFWRLAQRKEFAESLGYFASAHYEVVMHLSLSTTMAIISFSTFGMSLCNTLLFFGVIGTAGAAPYILPIIVTVAVGLTLALLAYKFYRTYSRRNENANLCYRANRFANLGLNVLNQQNNKRDDFELRKKNYETLSLAEKLSQKQNADLWITNTLVVIGATTALLSVAIALGATLPFWAPAIPAALIVVGAIYLIARKCYQSPEKKQVNKLKQEVKIEAAKKGITRPSSPGQEAKPAVCLKWPSIKNRTPQIDRVNTSDTGYGSGGNSPRTSLMI